MSLQPKVAISDTFMDAVFALPKDVQKKTMGFVRSFRENPRSPGLNYETIAAAGDKRMRSVRVDGTYRAIVMKPDVGDVYVLLYVAHHDNAYDWACRKRIKIHADTGSIQLLPTDMGTLVEPSAVEETGLLDHIRDRDLVRFGLPDEFLPEVRACVTQADLENLQERLPPEAYEALFWLADGESVEDVWRALLKDPLDEQKYDTEDIGAALDRPGSKRHFKVIEDEREVEELFDLQRWRIFLHEVQYKVAYRERSGPTRVLGGAGTGKTVVAMHRAKHLAETFCTESEDRILFTTYTKNLATDIRQNLEALCGPALVRERIVVQNLDAWVSDFLKRHDYPHTVRYFGPEFEEHWEEALRDIPEDLGMPRSFWREEWERVIQAQGIKDRRAYFNAMRTGRGVGLHRAQRAKAWTVFEAYRNILERHNLREAPDAMRDAAELLRERPELVRYKAVIVDESQDFGNAAFELIRRMVPEGPNDIFLVGDAHQRIYKQRVTLSHCGVRIVGRSFRLRINYRTTEEIRNFALAVLGGMEPDDLDEGKDSSKGYLSHRHGPVPQAKSFKTFDQEVDAIAEFLGENPDAWKNYCVTTLSNRKVDDYRTALEERGFTTLVLKAQTQDDQSAEGVRLATMHRVKGLEFDKMVVAGLSAGVLPRNPSTDDETVRDEEERSDRSLLYVALTRARSEALITATGHLSPFVKGAE